MQAETPLWADVYNATWERIGDGPIPLISASVTRAFDGAGTIQFEAPANDERVIALLKNERRVKIIYHDPQTNLIRTIGSGIIRKRGRKYGAGGNQKSFSGPDVLDELKRRNTFLNRIYTNQPVGDVASSLAGLALWQAETESNLSNLITARFDGASVLKALQTMTEQIGIHLREKVDVPSDRDHIIEVGSFGTDSGLWIMNPDQIITHRVFDTQDVAFIDSLTITHESSDMFNSVVAVGSGEGENALTLERATRSTDYARETMTVGGKTLYLKKNQASIDEYGLIEKVVTFKNISPVGNSDTSIELAANALDEATDAALARNGAPQTAYRLSIKKGSKLIRPGDVVHLSFRGAVRDRDGQEIADETVEGDFFVLKVTERVGSNGVSIDLEISDIDKQPQSEVAYVLSAIEDIQLRNMKPALTNFRESRENEKPVQQWDGQPSYTKTALFPLKLDNTVTDVSLVRVNFLSKPLYSYSLTDGVYNQYAVLISDNYPQDISLFLDGVDVTSIFGPSGGKWNPTPGNSQVDVTLDITDYIRNASGGLRQEHSIEFRVSMQTRDVRVPGYGGPTPVNAVYGNQGVIRCEIVVMGTAQAILTA